MTGKGPEAFRSISEAADELGVPQHVLRFWETKFTFVRPMKRAGGRRFYRPQDIAVLAGVRALLHREGYTIKGVQNLHRQQGLARLMAAAGIEADPGVIVELETAQEAQMGSAAARPDLDAVLKRLRAAKAQLDDVLAGDADTMHS